MLRGLKVTQLLVGTRRRMVTSGVLAVLLFAVAVIAATHLLRPHDVSNSRVEFVAPTPATRPPAPSRPITVNWPLYGFDHARTKFMPAPSKVRPPFKQLWKYTSPTLLEFSPALAGHNLYLVRNDGYALSFVANSGRLRWKKRVGALAAASPAVDDGAVYVVVLKRDQHTDAGRVAALRQRDGHRLWARNLPSRAESSPLVLRGSLYFGSENGTVYALSARTGHTRWTYQAAGAVKAGLAYADGKLFFGDYGGQVQAIRASDGKRVWATGTRGGTLGLTAGNFYSTPAVAFGRVYVGNTDSRMYSFSARTGELAWTRATGAYVYSSPGAVTVPGLGPTVYVGSYDGHLYAYNARSGATRWSYNAGGRISGGVTIIGKYVYFANLGARQTVGLSARTGRKLFQFPSGSFNPIISDGVNLYLTGYSSLYGLAPTSRGKH